MRLSLLAIVLLVAVAGAYAAFWLIAAGRIEDGLGRWAQSLRAHDLDLSWRAVRVGGFPFAFRLELRDATLRDVAPARPGEVRAPLLSAVASPWNFRVWRLAAPQGLGAASEPGGQHAAKMTARMAEGAIAVANDGGATLWLGVSNPAADAGVHVAAREAYLWLILPSHPPQAHSEPALGLALDVRDLALPFVLAPLRNPVDEIGFGITVMGRVPDAPLRQAAISWRDAGGTVELDHFGLRWGTLAVRASGTVALDSELQPEGAFSGAIEGYPELMTALVAGGRMRRDEAGIAGLALALFAKTGPDGRPEISTSLTIQDGQIFLGPARLGPAPRIAW